ncbi:GH21248 [Drosophila grimshawi]|uniref:GH21248 n=1 Tax=Drosophila grimshawi TaxID=7222 RepID=B4J7H9_DROGR|nr:GH21248 [Drosophila grimshawi]
MSSLISDDNDNDTDAEEDAEDQDNIIEDTIATPVDPENGVVLLSAVAMEQEISLELLLNASSNTFDLDALPTTGNHVVIDTIDHLTDCSESTC